MANGNIGVSAMDALQPGARPQGTGQGGGMSPQQAVKILSLRVPERASQGSIAPLPLLTSKGGAQAGAQGLDTMVAALMRAFSRQQPLGAGPQAIGTGQQPMMGAGPQPLPSGGDTDTTSGWRGNEPSRGGPVPDGVPYDAGTGWNPIPERPRDIEVPLAPSARPIPHIGPGQLAPDTGGPPSPDTWGIPKDPVDFAPAPNEQPPSLFDGGSAAPNDTAPLWDWRREKFGDGMDIQSLL